jgi:hypothetical protein
MRISIFLLLMASFLSLPALGQGNETFSFYRTAEGEVSAYTRDQAKQMLKFAKENGYITLWLVLNYPYNVDREEMTPDEIATQRSNVVSGFSDILDPLVAQGDAWYPPSGAFIKGPGCTVRATPKGLKQLLDDTRLYQITTFD